MGDSKELRKKPLYWIVVSLVVYLTIVSWVDYYQILHVSKEYISQYPVVYVVRRFWYFRFAYTATIFLLALLLTPTILYWFLKRLNPKVISSEHDKSILNIVKIVLLVLAIGIPVVIYFTNKQFVLAFSIFWIIIVSILWGVLEYLARRK